MRFWRKEPGLGFVGRYHNHKASAQLTERPTPCLKIPRGTEGAPWIKLSVHLLPPSPLGTLVASIQDGPQ